MISNSGIEVQTSPITRFSVPSWFAEVVILTQHFAAKKLLEALEQHVHLVRGRFGSYESIDFLALLFGYAISGERTLADFFERIAPLRPSFHGAVWAQGTPPSLQLEPRALLTWTALVSKPFVRSSSS